MKTNKVLISICFILSFSLSACSTGESTYNETGVSSPNRADDFCTIEEAEIMFEADMVYLSFEEAIELSTDVISATFVSYHEENNRFELEFEVNDVIKGSTSEETIFVSQSYVNVSVGGTDLSYVSGTYNYEPDQEYILVLVRDISPYYTHDKYVFVTDIDIPLAEGRNVYMYNEDLTKHSPLDSNANILSYVQDTVMNTTSVSREYYGHEYVDSDDLKTILAGTDYVLHVKVEELEVEGIYNDTDTFRVSIKEVLKGDLSQAELDSEIFVVVFKGDVTVGGDFFLLLHRLEEDSLIYTLSSRNSVIPVSETQEVDALHELLEQ